MMEENGQPTERSWANLPGKILYNISGRLHSIDDFMRFRSVCHPWRTKVTVTNMPHFVELNHGGGIFSLMNLCEGSRLILDPHENRRRFLGSSNGWLIYKSTYPLKAWLENPFSRSSIKLPPWSFGLDMVFFSSPPLSAACTALLVGSTQPRFTFCKPGDQCWRHGLYGYPLFSSNDFLCEVVALEGRFYALSLQGYLAVIECISQHQPITTLLSPMKVMPSWPISWPKEKKFYRYLVESGGKILVVFLLASVLTDHIDEVQVFRFDIHSLSWDRIYELDGRILFVGLKSAFSIVRTDEWYERGDVYFPEKGCFLFKSYSLKYNTMLGIVHRTTLRIQERGGWMLPSLEGIRAPAG